MDYQVLARKLRPKLFQDVIGQGHITQSLINSLQSGRIGHAYLFTGTRGVGKTSVARIFAKALRCEALLPGGNPCNQCLACKDFENESSLNVMEIDGASHNSVDNIRELVANVPYLPTQGRYKIYIIDEVHMLSTSAFNALLKTLEEPPAHVVFIFATTEPQKLLGTVLSRCQRFDFKPVGLRDLCVMLEKIAEGEGIHFENKAMIQELAKQGNGSARDTLSLLEQALSFSKERRIDEQTLVDSLGMARSGLIRTLVQAIFRGDIQDFKKTYQQLLVDNTSAANIALGVQDYLYDRVQETILKTPAAQMDAPAELFWIYETVAKDLGWALASGNPFQVLEIVLQKVCLRRTFFKVEEKKTEITTLAPSAEEKVEMAQVEPEEAPAPVELVPEPALEPAPAPVQVAFAPRTWDEFLAFLYQKSPASASNLEQGNILGELQHSPESLKLTIAFGVSSKVFFEYLNEAEVLKRLRDNLREFFQVDDEGIKLELTLIDSEQARESNFISKAEIETKKHEESVKEQQLGLINDPIARLAQELFNAKIDKVVLNQEQQANR